VISWFSKVCCFWNGSTCCAALRRVGDEGVGGADGDAAEGEAAVRDAGGRHRRHSAGVPGEEAAQLGKGGQDGDDVARRQRVAPNQRRRALQSRGRQRCIGHSGPDAVSCVAVSFGVSVKFWSCAVFSFSCFGLYK
jgi:hypothetical protein